MAEQHIPILPHAGDDANMNGTTQPTPTQQLRLSRLIDLLPKYQYESPQPRDGGCGPIESLSPFEEPPLTRVSHATDKVFDDMSQPADNTTSSQDPKRLLCRNNSERSTAPSRASCTEEERYKLQSDKSTPPEQVRDRSYGTFPYEPRPCPDLSRETGSLKLANAFQINTCALSPGLAVSTVADVARTKDGRGLGVMEFSEWRWGEQGEEKVYYEPSWPLSSVAEFRDRTQLLLRDKEEKMKRYEEGGAWNRRTLKVEKEARDEGGGEARVGDWSETQEPETQRQNGTQEAEGEGQNETHKPERERENESRQEGPA